MLRGSRDFDTTNDYADFVRQMVERRNRLVQGKLEQEAEGRPHRRTNRLRGESRLPSGKTWETFEHHWMPLALRRQLGYLAQGVEESEVFFTLIAECYERRSLGFTKNLVFSEWEYIFANPMAIAAAVERAVLHSVILEFDIPSYRTDTAQRRGEEREVVTGKNS